MLQQYIPLSEATKMFPGKNGKPVTVNTLTRWSRVGLYDGDVKLRTIKMGCMLVTKEAWIADFCQALEEHSILPLAVTPAAPTLNGAA